VTVDFMLTDMPMHYAGGGFPWGFLIIGGIIFLLWKNGMFDRFGNGGRFGGGPGRYGGGYGAGYGSGSGYSPSQAPGYGPAPEQSSAPSYGDPRAMFEEWHRQAHAAGVEHGHPAAPAAPPAPAPEAPASSFEAPRSGESEPGR
jgi:hypothetical protein